MERQRKNIHPPKIERARACCDSDMHMTDYDRKGPSPRTHLTTGSHIVRTDGVRRW